MWRGKYRDATGGGGSRVILSFVGKYPSHLFQRASLLLFCIRHRLPTMINDKTIVCVSASFENKEQLFHTICKYAQSRDERFAYWDEFAFTAELLPACDALLILNAPSQAIEISCYPEKVIAMMMEPGDPVIHPWMFQELEQYHRVYSPISQSANTVLSHGFLGWYPGQNYNYLKNLAVPEKTKMISCIASDLKQLEGHRRRLNFVNDLKQDYPSIDFFGKGSHFLPEKMDGLLPYKYSVAIENSSSDNYFTEKINDCFLAYTVPVYYGCRNIDKYFPSQSFIAIDIDKRDATRKKISDLQQQDDWNQRLPYIQEARELVLQKYQPLAGAAAILKQLPASEKKMIVLKPIQPGIFRKLKKTLSRFLNKTG